MKATRFLPLAAVAAAVTAAMTLAGCSKERPMDDRRDAHDAVRFTGNVDKTVTRVGGADGNVWDAGDPVGVYMLKADGTPFATGNVCKANKLYTASAGSSASFVPDGGTPLYYPAEGGSVRFAAYHPYTASAGADGRVPFSVADQRVLSAIDVLHAPVTAQSYNNETTGAVPLAFEHKLTRLVFVVSNGKGVEEPVSGGISLTVSGQMTAGTLDLATGAVETTGTAGELKAAGAATVEAIVLPAADLTGVVFTFVNRAGQNFVLAVPASTPKWEGGRRYTYTVTLRAAANQSDITGEIGGWENGGSAPGTADELHAAKVQGNRRITWSGGKYTLTTVPTDAGLYFMFGSVAGIFTANGRNQALPGTNTDTFGPEDVAWSPVAVTGTADAGWATVPMYNGTTDYPKTVTPESGYHTAANVKAGKGDPCRLVGLDLDKIKNAAAGSLTAADIDNGLWRLPTDEENKAFSGLEDNGPYTEHWTTQREVNGGMFPNTTLGDATTFLPTQGGRNFSSGAVQSQGASGTYWSSTPGSATIGFYMRFISGEVYPLHTNYFTYGFAVRCVRQ